MAHLHNMYDSDIHFKLDSKTRTFSNETELKLLVAQGDHNSERITFEIPRYIEQHDMLKCNRIEVHYINISSTTRDTSIDVYTVEDAQVSPQDENIIEFSWRLRGSATRYNGTLSFAISMKCLTDEVIDYRWNTLTYEKILVGKSLNNAETIAQEYSDVLEKWKKEVLENINPTVNIDTELNEKSDNAIANCTVAKKISQLSDSIDTLKGGTYSSIEPSYDDIPKVFFDEAIPQTKTESVTKFRYISKTQDISGYAEFKAQGNSSMTYPKKNMTVKMYEDEALENKLKVDFKGWGKQSKHVYKANWVDLTHARNIVSARIWADIVKSRSDYENYPSEFKASPNQGAIDGFPIKVYSKGKYQGRYTLNIPKDAWTFNMDKDLDNHCILCGEGYVSGCFREVSVSQWKDEVHDKMPTSINTRWIEIINFVMNSTDEEFKANLSNYFYVDSLIDYLIYGIVSCGLDAFGKNQIYATYDGYKWIASMYDMDWTWGLHDKKFEPYDYARESYEDYKVSGGNLLYVRLAQLFSDEIKVRYEELKATVLTIPYLINQFERFTDITPLDLVKEDYATTTGTGNFNGIPLLDSNNIQQIRDYIINRFAYADAYINGLTYDGDDSGDTPTEATLTSINATYNGGEVVVGTNVDDLMGITVVGTYSDGSTKNIVDYSLSGTINNGSNTITVSYQGKTTTFTVVGYVEEVEVINLLDGVNYTYGQEPNRNTGVVASVSGYGMFDKVTLPQDGRYLFEVTGRTPSVCLYDENDAYIGVLYNCGGFIAKAGWKVICKCNAVEGTDYSSVARLVQYTTDNVQETISIDLSNRTWEKYGNSVNIIISEYGIVLDNIVSSNIPLQLGRNDANIPKGELVGAITVSGSITRLYFFNRTVDQITTYFAENPTTLVLNG